MIPPTKTVLDEREAETDQGPDAPMTEAQAIELRQLCEELEQPFDASLSEAEAHDRIEALKTMKADKQP